MFYIVWSPEGPTNPRIKHGTSADAQVAASNMARKHVGQTFFVMKCAHEFRFDRKSNQYGSWAETTSLKAKEGVFGPAPKDTPKSQLTDPWADSYDQTLGDILRDVINRRSINQVPEGPIEEKKTMFMIKFKTDVKINTIKTLREITRIGLKEAKDAIEDGLIVSSDQLETLLFTFEKQWKIDNSHLPLPIFEVSYHAPVNQPYKLPYGTVISDTQTRGYRTWQR